MKGTIRFASRRDKARKDGSIPVEMIYSIYGNRKVANLRLNIPPFSWDQATQSAVYINKEEAKKIDVPKGASLPLKPDIDDWNKVLSDAKSLIRNIEQKFELDEKEYTSQDIIDEFKERTNVKKLAVKEQPTKLIFDFIDRYVRENEPSRAKGSLSVYKALKKHLQEYEVYSKKKIRFSDINYLFFQSFQNFLIKQGNMNNITIAKQLSTLKTFVNYAKKHNIKVDESIKEFKIKMQKLEVIALTENEFSTLYNLDLTGDDRFEYIDDEGVKHYISYAVLSNVRDVFCFSCASGLRYSDLAQLKREHIKATEIRLTVKKTKEIHVLPINGFMAAILDRNKGQARPLPVLSNQKYNDYVKLLCELAGIDEPVEIIRFKGAEKITTVYPKYELISSHTGRKTFCTLSLERGIPAELVMKLSGHQDYRSFQRYVRVTERRKKDVMLEAWGAPESKLKAVGGGE